MKKIVCLIGGGSRLPAIINYVKSQTDTEISLVVSHKKESFGIDLAQSEGINAEYLRWVDYKLKGKTRKEWEKDLLEKIKTINPDLIVMAGWMMLMSDDFLKSFPNKVINIHPALNPAFPGAHGIEDALNYGAKITGATVHFVPDSGVDSGPIIIQEAIKIGSDDNYETLRSKMDKVENKILVEAIDLILKNALKIEGRKVIIK